MFETMELPVRRGNVPLRVARGHFATNHSHINYYIDITKQKTRLSEAKAVAKQLAGNFTARHIDTILCLDGMGVIGTILAEALTSSSRALSDPATINVVEPEFGTTSQMIFRDNIQPMIRGKHVLILMASVTTGFTAKRSVEAIDYYGGTVEGIAALYRAVDDLLGHPVHSVYSLADLPDYESYDYNACPYCKAGQKLDALVNSFGYSLL